MSLASLPEVALQHVTAFLSAPDVLNFLSTSHDMANLGSRSAFWATLLSSQFSDTKSDGFDMAAPFVEGGDTRDCKDMFLQMAYRQALPFVEWKPAAQSEETPSAREGHLSCVLANRYLVVTGGYTDDSLVHVKDLRSGDDFVALEPSTHPDSSEVLCFAYGATLTPINDCQAIRFGGFRSGGYSGESSQVAVLTVQSEHGGRHLSANWRVIETSIPICHALRDYLRDREQTELQEQYLARAYHTATLMYDRYMLILGGMQSSASIWNPAVLDTQTWSWLLPPSSFMLVNCTCQPSPRHGHSTVWDVKRSRLIVFGGGSGNDLLRSGEDKAEVWATTFDLSTTDSMLAAFRDVPSPPPNYATPIPWRRVARDSNLSLAESLCLGRCHVSHRISPDTVLLAFGSGRPSTNGVLAYNLALDSYFSPKVGGSLPSPRFTTTSVLWNSYIFAHGGFTSQRSTSMDDIQLLDLAPALKRPLRAFRPATGSVPFYLPVTNEHIMQIRQRRTVSLEDLVMNLGHAGTEARAEQIRQSLFLSLLFAGRASAYGEANVDGDDDDSYVGEEENLDAEFEE